MQLSDQSNQRTRKIGDMDPDWLESFVRWKYGNAENVFLLIKQDPERFKKQFGDSEWQQLRAAWTKHCQRLTHTDLKLVSRELSLPPNTWKLLDALKQSNTAGSLDKAILAAAFVLLGKERTEAILRK